MTIESYITSLQAEGRYTVSLAELLRLRAGYTDASAAALAILRSRVPRMTVLDPSRPRGKGPSERCWKLILSSFR